MKHVKIISFTPVGSMLAKRIKCGISGYLVQLYDRCADTSLQNTALRRLAQQAMYDCDGIVFVGASGIAIRVIAPFLRGKEQDPAVLVLDEKGQFVVPLLSGHLGGANALAKYLADVLHATAVITTSTDVNQIFAVDTWAAQQGYRIYETDRIRFLSSAMIRGETVGVQSDIPIQGKLPEGMCYTCDAENGVVISAHTDDTPFRNTLHVIPRSIWVGIGCRKNTTMTKLEHALCAVLEKENISAVALAGLATIDRKGREPGLLSLAQKYELPVRTFSAEQLKALPGRFTSSRFVEQTVGVDNVCERAAVLASGGALVRTKFALDGATVALAEEKGEVRFS